MATPAATGTGTDVDTHCPLAGKGQVHEDFDAMLNQTNIGANNNKFYVIQLVRQGGKYFVWNRWGRVGEDGQNSLKGPLALDGAVKEFEKKFKDKTGNAWAARTSFQYLAGKYGLIEIDHAADQKKVEEREAKLHALKEHSPVTAAPVAPEVKPCTLAAPVQDFIRLIFDHDMFKGAMASFEIDVEKMPLGQLTKAQVSKGFEALEAVEEAMTRGGGTELATLTSRFYTLIPHAFGRRKPPVIATPEVLQKKRDMLNVLADIEIALGMQSKKPAAPAVEATVPHPDDLHYQSLKSDLMHVAPGSPEYDFIAKYIESTAASGYKPGIVDVFRVHRHGEDLRFKEHDHVGNRKLLWHGTNVAVVAAILGSGLRIMPHSGGRVGRGIYLASENGKSIGYVGPAGKTGVMFLAEAALGKEHHITKDDSSLREPPKGYDSIVAKGHGEPDSKHDIEWDFDGRKVVVPQGAVVKNPKFSRSSFSQSEYLVYKESQVRLRYALKIRMP